MPPLRTEWKVARPAPPARGRGRRRGAPLPPPLRTEWKVARPARTSREIRSPSRAANAALAPSAPITATIAATTRRRRDRIARGRNPGTDGSSEGARSLVPTMRSATAREATQHQSGEQSDDGYGDEHQHVG